jgi:hypothetical protein
MEVMSLIARKGLVSYSVRYFGIVTTPMGDHTSDNNNKRTR